MFRELRGVLLVFLLLCCTQIVLANATITINSPIAITYNNATILINITTTDNDTVWYNYNGTDVNYTVEIEATFDEGVNTLYVWANDTDNNITEANVTFTVDTIAPNITINSPINKTYDTSSITFNVTLTENGTCFYTLDSGSTNISMDTADNQTFNHTNSSISDGNYTAVFYCNDTIGNINITNVTFRVDTINPEIDFNDDTTNITLSNMNYIIINVTVNDSNLNYTQIKIYNSTNDLINTTNETYVNYTVPTDGLYYFNATTYDLAGRTNSTETRNVTIDTIAPSIIIDTPGNTTYNTTEITINITSNGNNTWFYNGTENETYTGVIQRNYTEGQHTIQAWTNDTAGNTNYTNITFTIDTIKPVVTINSPINTIYNSTNITLNYTVTDTNIDQVWYNYNGTNNTLSGNTTFIATEGISTIILYANDTAGNLNYTNVTFTTDTAAPSITIESPTNITYNTTEITINITSNGNNTWFYNGTENETYTGVIQRNYTEGQHTIQAWTNDTAGNLNYTNVTFTIFTNVAPTVTTNNPGNNSNQNMDYFLINATVNDEDLDNLTVWIYGDDALINTTYNQTNGTIITYNWTSLSEGIHNWTIIINDGTTNSTNEYNYFRVDTTAPNITFNTNTDNVTYTDKNYIVINTTALDYNLTLNIIYIYNSTGDVINSTVSTNSEGYVNYTVPGEGIYYFNATATDWLGNENSTETRNITIDLANPAIYFEGDTDNTTLVGRNYIIINITATDTNLNYTEINIYNSTNDLINTTNGTYINYTVPTDGLYYFNATTYDLAGRTNSTETRNITIDTLLPNLTFSAPSDSGNSNRQYILINVTANKQNIINITIDLYNSSNVSINSTTFTNYTAFINITNLTDDTYYYNATVYDTLNRVGYSITQNVTINTNFPEITLVDPTDTTPFLNRDYILINTSVTGANITNVTIELYNSTLSLINSTNDNESGIVYNFSNLTEGTYYFNVSVINLLNYTDTTETVNITIDFTNPTIIIENDTDNGTVVDRDYIIINVSATDTNLNNITIKIYDSNNVSIYNTTTTSNNITLNYTVPADGIYYFNATTLDKAGNYNYTETRNITIDFTNPTLSFVSPTENSTLIITNYILVNLSAYDMFLNNITVYLYDINYTLLNSSTTSSSNLFVNFTNLSDGTYYINATAYDNSNHSNITTTLNISTDTVIPYIIFNYPTSSGVTINITSITINITANDTNMVNNTIYIYYSNGTVLNSTTSNTTENVVSITNLSDGTYDYNVTAYDSFGNYNSTNTRSIIIDTSVPVVTPPSSGGGGSGGGGGTGGGVIALQNETTINQTIYSQYWPNIINGSRTINIDKTGMPLMQIIITTNNNSNVANTMNIIAQSINPYQGRTNLNATIYTFIVFDTSLESKYVNNLTFRFKVQKKWLTQNNLTADNVTIYNYNNNTWSGTNVSKYSEDTGYVYYVSSSPILSNMAIGGPLVPTTELIKENITSVVENNNTELIPMETVQLSTPQKGFFGKVWSSIVSAKDKIVARIMASKEAQQLIVVTISSILTLILGVVTGILVYKNAIKPRRMRRMYNRQIIGSRIMPYKEEPPIQQSQEPIVIPQVKTKPSNMPPKIVVAPDPEFNVRKISELLMQCEYAMGNGKIADAKDYYAQAKALYFNSNLDYEHKAKVYDKIISLHGKLNTK